MYLKASKMLGGMKVSRKLPSLQADESTLSTSNIDKDTLLECFPIGIEQIYHCERLIHNYSIFFTLLDKILTLFLNDSIEKTASLKMVHETPRNIFHRTDALPLN